jgi:hypothetical protein
VGHTYHLRFIPVTIAVASETPTFHQNGLAMTNTVDETSGKPITIWSQSIAGISADNSLVAFYDIHRKMSRMQYSS